MKKFLKLVVARRLAATPVGLAVLAAGWLLGRRHRKRRERREYETTGRRREYETTRPRH